MDIETAPAPPWAMTAQTLQQVAADLRQAQVVPEVQGQQVYYTTYIGGAWGDPTQVQQMPTEGAVGTATGWRLNEFVNQRNAVERAQQEEARNHQREELLAQELNIEHDAEWRA